MQRSFVKGKDNHQLEPVLMQIRQRCRQQDWKITAEGDDDAMTVTFAMKKPAETILETELQPEPKSAKKKSSVDSSQ